MVDSKNREGARTCMNKGLGHRGNGRGSIRERGGPFDEHNVEWIKG
jgi:hypothetical protein